MALEAVVFSQDHPLTSYNSCRDQYNFYNFPYFPNPFESIHNVSNQLWDNSSDHHHQQYHVSSAAGYSSPEGHCDRAVEQYLSREPEPPSPLPVATIDGGRRKRRRRSCKNKEEVEQQRMTHIAVERNRRRQMNDYLAVIRSLMPTSYVQRGDQASIVGGAINYVKELEQLLQSLEAHKRTKHHHGQQQQQQQQKQQTTPEQPPEGGNNDASIDDHFTGLLNFPHQHYSNGSTQQGGGCSSLSSNLEPGVGEVQVTMVESHANVKIMAKKQPKQLLRLVAGFQGLRLSVLHLNVTSVGPSFLLYSFSLKVEEGCQVSTVDDITAAANHILVQIQEESAALL